MGAGDAADDSIALLGAISQVTHRVGLRTSVALLGRSPAQLALAAATLQRLSGGRFRLGIGPGSQQRNEGWHGIPYRRMVVRTEEYLRTVRAPSLLALPPSPRRAGASTSSTVSPPGARRFPWRLLLLPTGHGWYSWPACWQTPSWSTSRGRPWWCLLGWRRWFSRGG